MRIRLFCLAILISGYCNVASAILPEQGIWWNPAEGGRGYGIEIQDNFIFVTYYGYTSDGLSAFYTSGGIYSITSNSASVYFASFSNGQCFGCAYQGDPTPNVIGNATLTFFSAMSGRIDLPSGLSIPIQRQLFFDTQPRTNLYGTWHLTSGALGVYFGQALWIQAPDDSLEGGFRGRVIDGSVERILVGAPAEDGTVAVLVDSSPSYYTFYSFEWSVNRWVGRSWTYLKTSQLSGSGLPFFGSRILGKAYSEQGATLSNDVSPVPQVLDVGTLDSVLATRQMLESTGGAQTKSAFAGDRVNNSVEGLRSIANSLAITMTAEQLGAQPYQE
ncbi:hypothetical protein [Dokdonella immobilis]|uniref:Uncharacterized protein n=1 Tax=Dokdonella immobilis TaxID=578942 RepID=A0A1I5BC81_9GAMM|nr:hypothetical protein [Dokdonella immobilis]SFN72139.1 hypothetical protein SAMN05216289_1631 [Dokdonella immobilis]